MLYEIAWLIFSLGVVLCVSIGFLGLSYSSAISLRFTRVVAEVVSLLVIGMGIFFA